MSNVVLTVLNCHNDDCGTPPNLISSHERWVSYWQDSSGDQFVFVYNFDENSPCVMTGDAEWETKFPVIDFEVQGLICDTYTRLWIASCYATATHSEITPSVLMRTLSRLY